MEELKEIRMVHHWLVGSLVPSSSRMNGEGVCECWHKVCALHRRGGVHVYMRHPLIHHYPPPQLPTGTTCFLPTSPSLFPLTHSPSLSPSFSFCLTLRRHTQPLVQRVQLRKKAH